MPQQRFAVSEKQSFKPNGFYYCVAPTLMRQPGESTKFTGDIELHTIQLYQYFS